MIIFDKRFKDVQRGYLVRLKDSDHMFMAVQFRKGNHTFFDLEDCTLVSVPTLDNVTDVVATNKRYELSVFAKRLIPVTRAIKNDAKALSFETGALYSTENYLFIYLSQELGFFNLTTLNVVEPVSSLTYVASFEELVITIH